MELVHLGHSCVVLDTGSARVLVDPGVFSEGYGTLEGLDAVLVTHQHPDHLDLDTLPALMAQNPDATLVVDPGTAATLRERGIEHVVREPGERFTVGDAAAGDIGGSTPTGQRSSTRVTVDVLGGEHEVIHPDIPVIANNAYLLADGETTVLHPGDSFAAPAQRPDVLLLPTAAPWMAIADSIDYLRRVAPPLAVPIHEAVLARTEVYYSHFRNLAPSGTDVRIAPHGVSFSPG